MGLTTSRTLPLTHIAESGLLSSEGQHREPGVGGKTEDMPF